MTFFDILTVMPRKDTLIQVYDPDRKKNSGIMKVGNVTYWQIQHYMYKKRVLHISPFSKKGEQGIFITLERSENADAD